MANLVSQFLGNIYTVVSANSSTDFDWSFNDTSVEGRSDDIFFILSCEEIELSEETYHSPTVRHRFGSIKVKCSIFANPEVDASTLADSFQSQICDKLFESSIEISHTNCGNASYNADYSRLEMTAFITAKVFYVY